MQSITNHQPEHTPGSTKKKIVRNNSEKQKRDATVTNKQIELNSVKQRRDNERRWETRATREGVD